MGDVLTFTPRPKPTAPEAQELELLTGPELRTALEKAAEAAVDAAERLIGILDSMDGDADLDDGADAEPSLAAPENHTGSQVTWLRGNDQDRETGAPETVLPEIETDAAATVIEVEPLRWGGRGNVLAAAGAYLFELLERA